MRIYKSKECESDKVKDELYYMECMDGTLVSITPISKGKVLVVWYYE